MNPTPALLGSLITNSGDARLAMHSRCIRFWSRASSKRAGETPALLYPCPPLVYLKNLITSELERSRIFRSDLRQCSVPGDRLAVRFSGMMGLRPCCALESVLKLGGAGDRPAPLGDPPTGTAASNGVKRPCPLAPAFALVPSGESPDGTG